MATRDFLGRFGKKLGSTIGSGIPFPKLYETLNSDKIKMNVPYDFGEAVKRLNEIKEAMGNVYSIVYKPHLKATSEEAITRSELSGPLSSHSFSETMRDVGLWKEKDGDMVPEYVHREETTDSIATYENRFVYLLVNLMDREVRSIHNDLVPMVPCFEEHFEVNGVSYGERSVFRDFQGLSYPYEGVFETGKDVPARVFLLAKKVWKMVKNVKGSEFYRLLSLEKPISGDVVPTNILLHDPIYNALYKQYSTHYRNRESSADSVTNILYYNYCLVSLFSYLGLLGIGKTATNWAMDIHLDKETGRMKFENVSFRKGMCSYSVEEDRDSLGVFVEVKMIDKAVRANTHVTPDKAARYYLMFSKDYDTENGAMIDQAMYKELDSVHDAILVTMNNLKRSFDRVLKVSYYDDGNMERIGNLIGSLGMLFLGDSAIYDDRCPVCGHHDIRFDGNDFHCRDCHSSYSVIDSSRGELIWLKGLRREGPDGRSR